MKDDGYAPLVGRVVIAFHDIAGVCSSAAYRGSGRGRGSHETTEPPSRGIRRRTESALSGWKARRGPSLPSAIGGLTQFLMLPAGRKGRGSLRRRTHFSDPLRMLATSLVGFRLSFRRRLQPCRDRPSLHPARDRNRCAAQYAKPAARRCTTSTGCPSPAEAAVSGLRRTVEVDVIDDGERLARSPTTARTSSSPTTSSSTPRTLSARC